MPPCNGVFTSTGVLWRSKDTEVSVHGGFRAKSLQKTCFFIKKSCFQTSPKFSVKKKIENNTDTRSVILQTASELFAVNGFDAVSIREISKAADVNIALISGVILFCRKIFF